MSEADYAGLMAAAHPSVACPGPLVLGQPKHPHQRCALTAAHQDWLTVVLLPSYAPDLNPAEGVWANMKKAWTTSPPATSISWPPSSGTG
jgi:putative transposase